MSTSYLAHLEDPSEWGMSGEVLVVFTPEPVMPPPLLVDPVVVGLAEATGVWHLKVWHAESRRGFYTRGAPGIEAL